ncbi:MAG: hypothetical protein EBU33_08720 [Sphingobacteriia bacterium]|nr:hypothetical protein [Sphingobacteriia bacterium]
MKNILLLILLCQSIINVHAGIFSSKQGMVFQTKGEAVIMKNSTFTTGIERRNIPVPDFIDIRINGGYSGLTHDSESGWTKCRVPLKGELGITGITERSMVFDCKPIQYFGN